MVKTGTDADPHHPEEKHTGSLLIPGRVDTHQAASDTDQNHHKQGRKTDTSQCKLYLLRRPEKLSDRRIVFFFIHLIITLSCLCRGFLIGKGQRILSAPPLLHVLIPEADGTA